MSIFVSYVPRSKIKRWAYLNFEVYCQIALYTEGYDLHSAEMYDNGYFPTSSPTQCINNISCINLNIFKILKYFVLTCFIT